jgi:2-hydroxymuconate-semialdehyde hydrolase
MSLPVQRNRVRVSGGELAYADVGEGPPILLLHGFPTSAFLWRRETWLFSQRMRVIVPDLLGYGESDKPGEGDLSEPAQAGYVRELLDHLQIHQAAVVGHDIGGAVAQILALDHPELRIPALILLDSPSFDVWPIDAVKELQGTVPDRQTGGLVAEWIGRTLDLGVAHKAVLDEATLRGYVSPWLADPPAFFRAARGIRGVGLAGRDDDLSALRQRVLLVWGEDDPFIPPEVGERLNDLIPGSTLALLPGCAHFVTEDAASTVGPLVSSFLRTSYLSEEAREPPGGPVPVFLERPPERFHRAED